MDNFYENIGEKIKNLAKVSFIITAIVEIIAGIVIAATDEDLILVGVLLMVLGPVLAWTSTLCIYGFGELIENSADNKENIGRIQRSLMSINNKIATGKDAPAPRNTPAAPAKAYVAVAEKSQPATPAETTVKQESKKEPPKYEDVKLAPGEKLCPHCGKVYKSLFCGCGTTDSE